MLSVRIGGRETKSSLLRSGISVGQALRPVLAADTVSILTMEVVDNLVMWLVPGAMDAGLLDALFWGSMALSLVIAYFAAYPVNKALLRPGVPETRADSQEGPFPCVPHRAMPRESASVGGHEHMHAVNGGPEVTDHTWVVEDEMAPRR